MLHFLTTVFGVVMSVAYFPQAYAIWKNKSAKDISLLSFSIFGLGTTVWTLYGISIHDWVIIPSFALGMVGSWMVLFMAIRYRKG